MSSDIIEVVEVVGAENTKPYTDKGWIILGTIPYIEPPDYHFIYSLGRTLDTPQVFPKQN